MNKKTLNQINKYYKLQQSLEAIQKKAELMANTNCKVKIKFEIIPLEEKKESESEKPTELIIDISKAMPGIVFHHSMMGTSPRRRLKDKKPPNPNSIKLTVKDTTALSILGIAISEKLQKIEGLKQSIESQKIKL